MTDKTRNKRRPSIYLSPALERINEGLRQGQSLSGRLATIAERYELVCSQQPDLSDNERHLLCSVLSGTFIEPMLIKHLDSEIEDSDTGDIAAQRDFAARVRDMSLSERVAMIESLGY